MHKRIFKRRFKRKFKHLKANVLCEKAPSLKWPPNSSSGLVQPLSCSLEKLLKFKPRDVLLWLLAHSPFLLAVGPYTMKLSSHTSASSISSETSEHEFWVSVFWPWKKKLHINVPSETQLPDHPLSLKHWSTGFLLLPKVCNCSDN